MAWHLSRWLPVPKVICRQHPTLIGRRGFPPTVESVRPQFGQLFRNLDLYLVSYQNRPTIQCKEL